MEIDPIYVDVAIERWQKATGDDAVLARTGERFGAEHVVDVLLGADTERVRRWDHDRLTTYGLMKGTERKVLTNMLYQLLDDGLLDRSGGDRPRSRCNRAGH